MTCTPSYVLMIRKLFVFGAINVNAQKRKSKGALMTCVLV
jgi:hypothetical protein